MGTTVSGHHAAWHLGLCAYPYILAILALVCIFFISGTRVIIAMLICSMLIIYGKITSEAIRVIWDVYSLLVSAVFFGGFINNYTQSVGGKVGDDFSQPFTPFFPFRSGMSPFENIPFPLDVKDALFFLLILLTLLYTTYSTFRIRAEISIEVVQISAPVVENPEWHGM